MFHANIKKLALENDNFRKVVNTGKHAQLVLMSIPVGEDIGLEIHPDTDQVLFLVSGSGEAVLNGESMNFKIDEAVFVPAGVEHNFKNTGTELLKLYTIYSPPEHADGKIHQTKADAQKDKTDHP